MTIYTYDPKKDKQVKCGELDLTTKIFTRKVNSKHFLRCLQAYGLQTDVLHKIKESGGLIIRIIESQKILEGYVNLWEDKGILKDYGHGLQRFLPIKYMKEITK